jgi:hypothetical protein
VEDPAFEAKVSAPVWLNLPPARVWIYRPSQALELEAKPCRTDRLDIIDKLKASGEKLSEEWREQRDKLRAEFRMRSSEARAELKVRALNVKLSLEFHKARVSAARKSRVPRPSKRRESMADKRSRW